MWEQKNNNKKPVFTAGSGGGGGVTGVATTPFENSEREREREGKLTSAKIIRSLIVFCYE